MCRILAAAVAAMIAIPAAAQDWKSEWAKTVAAAEQEGELVMNSMPFKTARDFLLTEWPKAYPKIKLNLSVVREAELIAKLRTERAAGRYLWDFSLAGAQTGYTLSKQGMIDPFLPEIVDPDLKRPELWGGWDDAFMDTEKKYVFSITSFIASPFYNATLVSPAKVERLGLKAVLEPEYAGKVYWLEPTLPGGGRTLAQLVHKELGDDGLRRLLVDQKTVLVSQQQQVVEAMARKLAWIGILPSVRALIAPYLQAGVDVKSEDLRTFGTTPDRGVLSVSGATLYVFNKRPHPNATKVFLNWILSKDMQYGFAKATAQASRRQDVPHVGPEETKPVKGVKYITPQREENVEPQSRTLRYIAEIKKTIGK